MRAPCFRACGSSPEQSKDREEAGTPSDSVLRPREGLGVGLARFGAPIT